MVCPFVHLFVHLSPTLGYPARPEAQPARPEAKPARPETQPARSEAQQASQPSLRLQAWLAGLPAWLDGPEGGTDRRMDGRMDGQKDKQKISPFYSTLSPIGAAALPPPMKTKEKVEQGKGTADHLMPLGYLFPIGAAAQKGY